MIDFEVGEVVTLKGAYMAMTVDTVSKNGAQVLCVWFNGDNELIRHDFKKKTLKFFKVKDGTETDG